MQAEGIEVPGEARKPPPFWLDGISGGSDGRAGTLDACPL